MFRLRKEKFSVTDGDPIFEVRYIGHREVERAFGRGCTTGVVTALWTRCPYEKCLPKAFLRVGLNGISLSMPEKPHGRPKIVSHDIKDISYCCVETDINEKIFAWINRETGKAPKNGQISDPVSTQGAVAEAGPLPHSKPGTVDSDDEDDAASTFLRSDSWMDSGLPLICHAVVASKPSRAQTMAATLRRAFHIAYKDWKLDKSRSERSRLVKSLTDRDLDLRRCKADSGLGDFEDTGSVSSSIYQPSLSTSDDVESNLSVSSDPK